MGMLMETNAESRQSALTNHQEFPQADDYLNSRRLADASCEVTCANIWLPSGMRCFEIPCFHRGILVRNENYKSWLDHQVIANGLAVRMQLLEPRTKLINDCLMDYLLDEKSPIYEFRDEEHWLGGRDLFAEGKWIWDSDETPFWTGDSCGRARNFDNWWLGEPNSWDGDEDCVMRYGISRNGRWNDAPCNALHQAFYELA
eukprot:CAMPEP_0185728458 /NCGR_PEP_ID=MMETSP1171-20130828/3788_1 /TAXON_ID=374046 /ORGANISM="Helicotheca tamensis, Strain CCMP826" /LENGTH=200 /DNA_ID=CAMNT_0028397173 /DNA_START=90 /DNA_END=692 /DNA_ORIENTATION=+